LWRVPPSLRRPRCTPICSYSLTAVRESAGEPPTAMTDSGVPAASASDAAIRDAIGAPAFNRPTISANWGTVVAPWAVKLLRPYLAA
jgi:hypothetical protein